VPLEWRRDLRQDALQLCETTGREFQVLVVAADELRRRQVGDIVTYVINRNVNFTNVCVKHCGFCAFSRTYRNEQGYMLPLDEILRRTGKPSSWARLKSACRRSPDMDGRFYIG
jgi:FO synthase subunit 2